MWKNEEWTASKWDRQERLLREHVADAGDDTQAWRHIVRQSRSILKTYSTSFFMVTRFLPPEKREQVEVIYASVRYPDEIVDTFPISPEEKRDRLKAWRADYETALTFASISDAVAQGVPGYLAAFAKVVKDRNIPTEHYHAFLDAMTYDIAPEGFDTLDSLINNYIYGSAIVVGYFLTHVYNPVQNDEFKRALKSARNLAIALQLTNFLRDIAEDKNRGRLYLPREVLTRHGIASQDELISGRRWPALQQVIRDLGDETDLYYARAEADIDAFMPDSRIAIQACIDVYRQLNDSLMQDTDKPLARVSVPMTDKFRVLPVSKYWRLPLAYLHP